MSALIECLSVLFVILAVIYDASAFVLAALSTIVFCIVFCFAKSFYSTMRKINKK